MQLSPEIFVLRSLGDTVLIGPRAAFGRGHRHAEQSSAAVLARLRRARADGGAMTRLRRAHERWNAGASYGYLTDAALLDRIAADSRRGRLAVFFVPNGDVRQAAHADPAAAEARIAGYQPRGVASPSTRIPVAGPGQLKPFEAAASHGPLAALPATSAARVVLNVGAMSIEQRFVEILHRTCRPERIGHEAVAELKALIDPKQIATTVAVMAVWAASHAVGIGFVVDGVMLGFGVFTLGTGVIDAGRNLRKFIEISVAAKTEAELELAADMLARVIVQLGMRAVQALLKRSAARVKSVSAKPEGGKFGKTGRDKPKPTLPPVNKKEQQLLLGPGRSENIKLLPPGKSDGQKLLPAPRRVGNVGHTRPWEAMTKAERRAFQHSYNRHGEELGLPKWQEKNAPDLQKQFNNVVEHVRTTGTELGGPIYKPINGKSVEVRYFESELNGVKYYFYENKQTGQFVSAGKSR